MSAGWLQFAVAAIVPTIVFIFIFATMREKISNVEKRLDKIAGNSERIAVAESKIEEHENKLAWGERRISEIMSTLWRRAEGGAANEERPKT